MQARSQWEDYVVNNLHGADCSIKVLVVIRKVRKIAHGNVHKYQIPGQKGTSSGGQYHEYGMKSGYIHMFCLDL